MCIIIKNVEKIKVNKKPLLCSDKKLIALEIGRIFLNKNINDDDIKFVVLNLYNSQGEAILEN